MNKQFIDGVLEVLREDGRQICKQAAHIIAELAEEIEALQSLSDFQRRQKSCMDSAIEKMKCCANCENTIYDGGKRSERELEGMRIDNGVIARGEDGFAGENPIQ